MKRRHADGTIDSIQRDAAAVSLAADGLERIYFDELRRVMLGLVRVRDGAIRVLGRGPALLRFGPHRDGRRAIVGGIFARRPGGTISWGADGEHVWVAVEGFAPLLGSLWSVEALLHEYVGRRYLDRAVRERG